MINQTFAAGHPGCHPIALDLDPESTFQGADDPTVLLDELGGAVAIGGEAGERHLGPGSLITTDEGAASGRPDE